MVFCHVVGRGFLTVSCKIIIIVLTIPNLFFLYRLAFERALSLDPRCTGAMTGLAVLELNSKKVNEKEMHFNEYAVVLFWHLKVEAIVGSDSEPAYKPFALFFVHRLMLLRMAFSCFHKLMDLIIPILWFLII